MCGVGDAITTGTNADTGTNPDRECIAEIAARPRRPYHAFVSIPTPIIRSISHIFPPFCPCLPQRNLNERLLYIGTRLSSFSCVCEHFEGQIVIDGGFQLTWSSMHERLASEGEWRTVHQRKEKEYCEG